MLKIAFKKPQSCSSLFGDTMPLLKKINKKKLKFYMGFNFKSNHLSHHSDTTLNILYTIVSTTLVSLNILTLTRISVHNGNNLSWS